MRTVAVQVVQAVSFDTTKIMATQNMCVWARQRGGSSEQSEKHKRSSRDVCWHRLCNHVQKARVEGVQRHHLESIGGGAHVKESVSHNEGKGQTHIELWSRWSGHLERTGTELLAASRHVEPRGKEN